MGFENGNDSTGTIPTYLIGGVDSDGKVRAIATDGSGAIATSGGGSGGGGDASADNQETQITRETEIRDLITDISDRLPSELVGDRLPVDVNLLEINIGNDSPIPVSGEITANIGSQGGLATDVTLQQVRDAIKAQIDIASTIWTDNSGVFYVRRDIVNEGTGTITVIFTDPTGTTATPGAGLRPLATTDKDTITDFYDVITSAAGYSIGDLLARIGVLDINSSTPSITVIWINLSLGTVLGSAPSSVNIERANESVGARQIGTWNFNLPTNASTESTLAKLIWASTDINSTSSSYVSTNGSEKTWTVPTGFEWQITSFNITLATSSVIGPRQISIRTIDASNNIRDRLPAGITQSASLTRYYTYAIGLPDFTSFRDTDKLQTPLPPLILPAGFKIKILDTAAIDTTTDALTVRGLVLQRSI